MSSFFQQNKKAVLIASGIIVIGGCFIIYQKLFNQQKNHQIKSQININYAGTNIIRDNAPQKKRNESFLRKRANYRQETPRLRQNLIFHNLNLYHLHQF